MPYVWLDFQVKGKKWLRLCISRLSQYHRIDVCTNGSKILTLTKTIKGMERLYGQMSKMVNIMFVRGLN